MTHTNIMGYMQQIDLESWNRKAHFEFFKQFDEPFFGVCVNVDVTEALAWSKASKKSFFATYLYDSLCAANATEPFRYRIADNGMPVAYDAIHASPTINRLDGTFGFGYITYSLLFDEFEAATKREVKRVQQSAGLELAAADANIIHYSTLPWLSFTSLSHARHFSFKESIPKITFGKVVEERGRWTMPVAVHVHHALMDGSDVAKFIDSFQELLNSK